MSGKILSAREILTETIDATPTVYRGVSMRSRLEAEFASLLDERDLSWEYEPAVFGPIGQGYLPDFRIGYMGRRCYLEIKPTLEQAEAKKGRMRAIFDAEPDALVLMVSADGTWQAALRDRDWVMWREHWHRSFPKRKQAA